eukprot:51460-Chlamydomonas_euryale.AAC.2
MHTNEHRTLPLPHETKRVKKPPHAQALRLVRALAAWQSFYARLHTRRARGSRMSYSDCPPCTYPLLPPAA